MRWKNIWNTPRAKIEKDKSRENLRHRVAEAFLHAPTENELREKLRVSHIDLYLRRNDTDALPELRLLTTKINAYSRLTIGKRIFDKRPE